MQWNEPSPLLEDANFKSLVGIGIDPITSRLLINRNINTPEEANNFFNPSIKNLHNPSLMKDMDKAVNIITEALEKGERIMIFGDYDVDGTTSVALLYTYLNTLNGDLLTYVPNRYTEGYGISIQGIDHAKEEGVSLIIAIDCGIRDVEQIAYAKGLGIDFIICDHHLPSEETPDALAILNPKQEDCNYPYKELCACAVGFKLIQAMHSKRGGEIEELLHYLDLVAIATASDLVPLTGENRILAATGLKQLNKPIKRVGIQALIESCGINKEITSTDLGFKIGPRINAAGRMESAIHSVNLLIEESLENAKVIADKIEKYNQERRKHNEEIAKQALEQIIECNETNNSTTVVFNETWHRGVLGIVASKLIENHYRPTIVFGKGEDIYTASARSVKGFNIYDALNECADLLEKFGGHKYAAGLSLKPENYEAFKNKFEEVVKNTIKPECLIPKIDIEVEVSLSDLVAEENANFPKIYRILKRMQPFGPGNNSPIFISKAVVEKYSKKIGEDSKHLRLSISDNSTDKTFTGIGFNLADKIEPLNKNHFDVVYSLDENHWNNNVSLQLMLKDVR